MKPTTLFIALLALVSPAHAEPEVLNPFAKLTPIIFTHGDEYEVRPVPEGLKPPEGLSVHVESVKDGSATCLLINNSGKPVHYTGEQESPIYHLEKRAGDGKWVKVEMWIDCADGLTRTILPAGQCRRFRIEFRDPVVRVKMDCYSKIPKTEEESRAFAKTAWSKEIRLGEKKATPGAPVE